MNNFLLKMQILFCDWYTCASSPYIQWAMRKHVSTFLPCARLPSYGPSFFKSIFKLKIACIQTQQKHLIIILLDQECQRIGASC